MPTPVGGQGHCGISKEASFAAGGTIEKWFPITSESLNPTFANVYTDQVRNSAEQVGGQAGNESVAGDIVFPVTPKMPAEIFICGLGSGDSLTEFHVERPLDSLMIEIDHETAAVQASGAMIESLVFSSTQGGELSCTASIQAEGMNNRTAGTPVYSGDNNPYLHSDAAFRLNNTADTSITTWSLTIANTLITDLYGTTKRRIDIPAGKLVVTGTFTKLFDDTTERAAFLAQSERSFQVKFSRGTNYLTFLCPEIRYETHTENIGGQSEYILETYGFTSYVDTPATRSNSLRVSGDFS